MNVTPGEYINRVISTDESRFVILTDTAKATRSREELYPVVNASAACCGIKEINGIRNLRYATPAETMGIIVQQRNTYYNAWILFSDLTGEASGPKFKKFIEENNLGTVHEMPSTLNRNSGNYIIMWIWTPDHKALEEWGIKNGFIGRREKKVA